MLKKRQDNSGFTLVELVVSIAILAFIIIAISGVMSSNNVIFRKVKSDIDIQTIAQDTESKIINDVMQAKFIYIEGYTADSDITFDANEPGKDLGASSPAMTPIKLVNDSDMFLMDSSDFANINNANFLVYTDTQLETVRAALSSTPASGETYSDREKFDIYYNKVHNMSGTEKGMYVNFLSDIYGSSYTSFASSSLKSKNATGSPTVYSLKDIYVTRMVMYYQMPLNKRYYSGYDTVPEKDRYVYCKVEYTVTDNKLHVETSYIGNANVTIDGSGYANLADSEDYTDCLNYVKTSAGNVAAFKINVDSPNNALNLNMNFVKNKMRYNSETVIQFRNSYVIKDSK